jgi:cytoskeletal protein CcmA (bactofilin family)
MNLHIPSSRHPAADGIADRSMRVDGAIKGNLSGSHIVLGSNAEVDGDIAAAAVTIHGRFFGQIEAQSVNLCRNSIVGGTIRYRTLAIELGARFEGKLKPIGSQDALPLGPALT